MRVLVTGGAGFIGSHVVDRLVDRGDDVVVLDSLAPSAHAGPPDHLNPGAEHVRVDLSDRSDRAQAAVRAAVLGVDAVSHQAARVGLGVDPSDLPAYVADNDLGTANLLAALWAERFRGRLVLASSMVVYGEGAYRCSTHGRVHPPARDRADLDAGRFEPGCPHCGRDLVAVAVDERARLDPRNGYAATKVHQEHLCEVFGRETEASVIALRYHNVYGPRMPSDTPYAGVASIFRSALERGEAPRVFEDGRQRRDFVHVDDVARANLAALDAGPDRAGAYNVASGHPHTIGEMAAALAGGRPGVEPIVTGAHRLGDVRHVFASPERARRRLGFRAEVAFGAGMADFVTAPLRTPVASG